MECWKLGLTQWGEEGATIGNFPAVRDQIGMLLEPVPAVGGGGEMEFSCLFFRVFLAKQGCTLSGIAAARRVFEIVDPGTRFEALRRDGETVAAGAELAVVSGRADALLAGERTAPNLLQRLAGIAGLQQRYALVVRHLGGVEFVASDGVSGGSLLE